MRWLTLADLTLAASEDRFISNDLYTVLVYQDKARKTGFEFQEL